MIGDKAYDSDPLDQRLLDKYGIEMISTNRARRKWKTQDGRPLRRYRRRWKVERLFDWLNQFRRIVVRYESESKAASAFSISPASKYYYDTIRIRSRRQLVVWGNIGKMGKRRTIPINDSLRELFVKWPPPCSGHLFPMYSPDTISRSFDVGCDDSVSRRVLACIRYGRPSPAS